jgi:hypothetical protein
MVRNNIVPGINVIYNTDGVNGISANVIEQNRGVLVTDFSDARVPRSKQHPRLSEAGDGRAQGGTQLPVYGPVKTAWRLFFPTLSTVTLQTDT